MFANELETQAVQVSKYAPQTYDAVWAIALALSGAENIWRRANNTTVGHFDYSRRDMAAEFLTQLGRLNFLGISVSIDDIPPRVISLKRNSPNYR